ncbi:MAG: helix-turn-helix domain-containing protein [Pseudomonadota bacterium]
MTHWNSHWSKRPAHSVTDTLDREPYARHASAASSRTEPTRTDNAAQNVQRTRPHLTTPEAAAYLGVSPRSLERYRVEGTGPPYLKAGPGKRARVFYRLSDLDQWLEGRVYTSTSEYGL